MVKCAIKFSVVSHITVIGLHFKILCCAQGMKCALSVQLHRSAVLSSPCAICNCYSVCHYGWRSRLLPALICMRYFDGRLQMITGSVICHLKTTLSYCCSELHFTRVGRSHRHIHTQLTTTFVSSSG